MSIGLPTSGDIMSMDDTNCELMLPSTVTESPFTGPLIVIGALPPSDLHSTPHPSRASSRGPMGLLRMDSSPVMVVSESNRAAMPDISLIVVPEFRTSIVLSGAWIPSDSTVSLPSPSVTRTPIDLTASAVALMSREHKGLSTSHLPPERAAASTALWV